MLKSSLTIRCNRAATLLVIAALMSGCTQASNWLKGRRTADAEPVILGAPETNQYISEIYELVSGDPATQAEIYADSRAAAQLTPDPSTRLRFALVLATPGHSESSPDEAQTLLRDLLSQKELMTPGEISLATISLRQVEERIMLGAETNRLRSENNRAATTEEAAVTQRIASVEAENRRLRQSLAEAEEKLEAITSIERAIREQ
ncbi:MAG: hypothetical protein OEW68_09680 [Gammaproteobacteria bacterium]|nr:hypothetical protein [Gammaproteobacteria bacterium]MDH4315099.1 hypothetical protein [Gammaproteobacteria bacterium]